MNERSSLLRGYIPTPNDGMKRPGPSLTITPLIVPWASAQLAVHTPSSVSLSSAGLRASDSTTGRFPSPHSALGYLSPKELGRDQRPELYEDRAPQIVARRSESPGPRAGNRRARSHVDQIHS